MLRGLFQINNKSGLFQINNKSDNQNDAARKD